MDLRSGGDKVFAAFSHVFLALFSFLAIMPFWLLIASSFTDEKTVTRYGYSFIPQQFSTEAYRYIIEHGDQIGHAYVITMLVTVIGTIASILICVMFAYGLMHKVPGSSIIFVLVLVTMLFNGGIVPTYYIYTRIIGVKNTIFGLIMPGLLLNAFNVILVRNFLKTNVPGELLDAAKVDGAGHFRILFQLVMPMVTPILATIGLMTAIGYWNDWTNGLYYISDANLFSIQQLLNRMNDNIQWLSQNAQQYGLTNIGNLPTATVRMAIAVVAIIPIMIVYPFFQKYFARGLVIGAIKG
jgi:putative aldouronate transport system permease protein